MPLIAVPGAANPAGEQLRRVPFESLDGWRGDALGEAMAAFRRSCEEILADGLGFRRQAAFGGRRGDWLPVCRAALAAPSTMADAAARAFFERHFVPFRVVDPRRPEGLFTGYFEPELAGARRRGGVFQVPIYRRPPELASADPDPGAPSGRAVGRKVTDRVEPYPTRREIENGALNGRRLELAWLASWVDAFFLHVQGSGRIRLASGQTLRLAFAAKNGHPYTSIGRLLVERGAIAREAMSMQALRAWLEAHPDDGRRLMWENASFIFFREIPAGAAGEGPPGAQQVPLTPRRSLAIDRDLYALGTPVWLETGAPTGAGGSAEPFRHLLVAQDAGSAITGLARGDVFWGAGEGAGRIAGPMQSAGRMTILLPRGLAERFSARVGGASP